MEVHEKRIVKLMSVIEALTTAGDERTDMRVLAEKMSQLREVRELLEDERSHVKAFQKRQRELGHAEAEAERENHKRRVQELEAESKMLRSLSQAQVDEVSQSHAAEVSALNRRVQELEEEKKHASARYEQRLADEKAQRYSDSQERERRRLALEESCKSQVAEARREAAEAQSAMQQAQARSAALVQQVQTHQRELLLLQSSDPEASKGRAAAGAGLSATMGPMSGSTPLLSVGAGIGQQAGSFTMGLGGACGSDTALGLGGVGAMGMDGMAAMLLEREREAARVHAKALEEQVVALRAELTSKAEAAAAKESEHAAALQRLKGESDKERRIASDAAEAERRASQTAMSKEIAKAMGEAEERHLREAEKLRAELRVCEKAKEEVGAALEAAQAELLSCQAKLNEANLLLKAERKRCMEIELKDLEAAEAREAEIEAEAAERAVKTEALAERQREQRQRVAMKYFRGAQERIARLLFASWSRWTKTRRLVAARERAAQLLAAADEVRMTAQAQQEELAKRDEERDSIVGQSIGAMRQEALRRQSELAMKDREIQRLKDQLEAELLAADEAYEASQSIAERAAEVQRRAAYRLFAVHCGSAARAAFVAWRGVLEQRKALDEEMGALNADLDRYEHFLTPPSTRLRHPLRTHLRTPLQTLTTLALSPPSEPPIPLPLLTPYAPPIHTPSDRYEEQLREADAKALSQQEKMSMRILQQLVGSFHLRLLRAWHTYASDQAARKRQQLELQQARRDAEAEQERLWEELADTEASIEEKEAQKKEAMARRLLKGNSERQTLIVLGAWRSWARESVAQRDRMALVKSIAAAEEKAAKAALEMELKADAQKERIAGRIAKKMQCSNLVALLRAWREAAVRAKEAREEGKMAAMLSRVSEARVTLVRRAFDAASGKLLARVVQGWREVVAVGKAEARAASAEAQIAALRSGGEADGFEPLSAGAAAQMVAIQERIAAKLGAERGIQRKLMLIIQAWRRDASESAAERRREAEAGALAAERGALEEKREAEKERMARAHALRGLLGSRDKCFVAWRGEYMTAKLEKAAGQLAQREAEMADWHGAEREAQEAKTAAQMANVLERMNRDRLLKLCGSILSAWRRLATKAKVESTLGQNARQTALQLAEKDSLTGQLRLANAAREAEARRADMVRSEARLEGQARISQLEAALRRAELDARDAVRKAELEAEEARKAEVRSAQLQITELKSQLRLERLEKESAAEKVRNEMRQAHSAEQRELELLRADAAEVHALRRARDEAVREKEAALARLAAAEAGMGGASNELMLAEQNTQLKQITKLQLQLAELQSELRLRDQGAGGGGGFGGGRSPAMQLASTPMAAPSGFGSDAGGGAGGGFWEGLFGQPPSPDALSRRSPGDRSGRWD